jgi:DNA mismatch repair ATPase MutS
MVICFDSTYSLLSYSLSSFIPADCARIGITDKILTRISTRETVSRVQSAFMIDLQQVSLALSLATHRSLLVIDEFGKGTEASGPYTRNSLLAWLTAVSDGAGLACGALEYLLDLGDKCPKVLAATHYHGMYCSLVSSPNLVADILQRSLKVGSCVLDPGSALVTWRFAWTQVRRN